MYFCPECGSVLHDNDVKRIDKVEHAFGTDEYETVKCSYCGNEALEKIQKQTGYITNSKDRNRIFYTEEDLLDEINNNIMTRVILFCLEEDE